MIMQNYKKNAESIGRWWRSIVADDIYGMLMRWASAVTAIVLVLTTIVVIIKGVVSICSKGK